MNDIFRVLLQLMHVNAGKKRVDMHRNEEMGQKQWEVMSAKLFFFILFLTGSRSVYFVIFSFTFTKKDIETRGCFMERVSVLYDIISGESQGYNLCFD